MDELFCEVLVKKKAGLKEILLKILPVLLGILLVIGGLFIMPVLMLAGVVVLGLCFWLVPRQNIEYEYSYVNGTMDVDAIYGKRSRKHLGTYDLRQMEIMAQADSPALRSYEGRKLQVLDYSSGEEKDRPMVYAVILPGEGSSVKLLFQPNEAIKKDLRIRARQKFV